MSLTAANGKHLNACIEKMRAENLSGRILNTFSFYYQQIINGADGMIRDRDIAALDISEVKESDCLSGCRQVGREALHRTVRIVLNGGLGTTMGLTGPKSLIQAKDGLSFLEILLAQAEKEDTPLCFMNSFSTHEATMAEIDRLKPARTPEAFVQNKFPKILREDLRPATWPGDPRLEWNPPGHGDIYISLYTSGLMQRFLDSGIEYAFISNSDNLGASIDLRMLGFFSQHRIPFMMEVSRRKPSDAKGGHLARHRNGRIVLRESAQCPPDEMAAFQDINRYRFFNTNNIWIHLPTFKALIEEKGLVPLPLILNSKPLDPRDETSPPVYQVETAMGAAICLFDEALGVSVPRSRFLPVKSCADLLSIRSDRYVLTPERHLLQSPEVQTDAVSIHLDPAYYKHLDDFEKRFPKGPPSLIACKSLCVLGDVIFREGVRIIGEVTIENQGSRQIEISDGSVIDSDRIFF
jgi:UTP--glucose-1-phosphate uridylyltransferase